MQILVDPELREDILAYADEYDLSISELAREAFGDKVKPKKRGKGNAGDTLLKMAAHGFKGGPRDLATNDEYLYGKDAP